MNDMPDAFETHPHQPFETDLSMTDELFVKLYRVPNQGTFLPQHSHAYDHVTAVATGGVSVWVEGAFLGDRMAPASMVIEAGKKHTFCTLADNTVLLCIHPLFGGDVPEMVETHSLPGHD